MALRDANKIIFDRLVALIGLVMFLPVMIGIWLLIRIKMHDGSALFWQTRIGKNGKCFKLVKFRTMIQDHDGGSISVSGDSRITPIGGTLRKYKLDELPELWNVLKGEMSFVGPRPDVPGYADNLEGEDRKILYLRPGITGPATLKYAYEEELLAQQSDPERYNNEVIFPDKIKINLEYYYKHSILGDIKIIFKSIFRKYENTEK